MKLINSFKKLLMKEHLIENIMLDKDNNDQTKKIILSMTHYKENFAIWQGKQLIENINI